MIISTMKTTAMISARRESRRVLPKTDPRPLSLPAIAGRPRAGVTVLGEERLLEGGLAAHEVEQLVPGRSTNDGRDRPRDAHPQDVAVGHDIADACHPLEFGGRHGLGEPQLDVVMGEIPEALDAPRLHDLAVANDRDAVAGALDLAEDVTREEHGPAPVARLAGELAA